MGKLVEITKTITITVDEENEMMANEWLDSKMSMLELDANDIEESLESEGTLVSVDWNTDGEEEDLPKMVRVPEYVGEDDIADWLSDCYGFCVNSYSIEEE